MRGICTSISVLLVLFSPYACAWEDHPDVQDLLKDLEIHKIISNLTPEEQKLCVELMDRDEEKRMLEEYMIAHNKKGKS